VGGAGGRGGRGYTSYIGSSSMKERGDRVGGRGISFTLHGFSQPWTVTLLSVGTVPQSLSGA